MNTSALGPEFRSRGFVVVKGLLSAVQVEACVDELERLSGRPRAAFEEFRIARRLLPRPLYRGWTLPDGVTRTPAFWPLITLPPLLEVVRELLGNDTRFLQHTDLHVGFSALNWHRDSVNRRLGRSGDWDEEHEPYRLARVAFYFQSHAESGFALGLLPGSHRRGGMLPEAQLRRLERRTHPLVQALFLLAGRDPLAREAVRVATEPGDAVIFDPRLLHSGSLISGPKYSAFLAYGVPGEHFARHLHYYRHVRYELSYAAPPGDLASRLRQAGLLADVDHLAAPADAPAYHPGAMQRLLARAVRPRS